MTAAETLDLDNSTPQDPFRTRQWCGIELRWITSYFPAGIVQQGKFGSFGLCNWALIYRSLFRSDLCRNPVRSWRFGYARPRSS